MATLQSDWGTRKFTSNTTGVSGVVIRKTFTFDIVAGAASEPATNDVIEMGFLPAFNKVSDMILDLDDLDGVADLVLDVGMMSGDAGDGTSVRTVGDEFFDGSTLGQAGGIARMTLQTGFNVAAVDTGPRSIGIKVVTEAATQLTGQIRLHVNYAAV